MKRTRSNRLRAWIIYIVAAFQVSTPLLPVAGITYAQETTPTETIAEPCVAPDTVTRPTGSSGHTYAWNCDTQLWESPYFTWNPNTYVTTPKYAPQHTFNASTNLWEVREWQYVASTGWFEFRITSVYAPAPPPQQSTIENTGPDSSNTIENADGSITNTGPNSSNTISGDGTGGSGTINGTGPDSDNTISLDGDTQTAVDLDVDMTINNSLDSTAISGNASVLQNTLGGDATSGDALAMANILNMLQSTWGWDGGLPELYTANIQGDYFGDILIDPSLLTGTTSSTGCGCGDLTVNATTDATINNDVDLLAQSGDATVSMNTTGGNATTGDATALVNIVNMINSSITSGESFLGVLNINGNLNGDVLVAQDVIDELLAANVPTTDLSLCNCGDVLAEFTDNQTISNNIVTTASSGDATVGYNTSAGDATSGDAQTSVTVFNVTGRTVVGQNALLVFVNVMGEWIGFLVDAPSGSTAAMYGGDITENSLYQQSGDTEYDVETNATINNNINVAAHSGDADVSYNTRGGNATSGDADASANVSNIVNSNFSLGGWFGVLFINILGDWFGSFGVDTAYGNLPASPSGTMSSSSGGTLGTSAGAGAGSTASVRRPKPGSVRVFTAAVESDKDGNMVLARVDEEIPPTVSTGETLASEPSTDWSDALIGWLLIAVGGTMILYFFRYRTDGIMARG